MYPLPVPFPGRTRAGRCAIRRFIDIRSTAFLLALVIVSLTAGTEQAGNGLPVADSRLAISRGQSFFPFGWFDEVEAPDRLASMRSSGMNIVLPYTGSSAGSVQSYLDKARKAGLKVFVEIDPLYLTLPNPLLVRTFVQRYAKHPALYGWLLVDEPTLKDRYKAVTPAIAELLYKQIKSADPAHPVGIVFGVTENPRPWVNAMDILMYDDYVADDGSPEFRGLWGWRNRLQDRASMAASLDGYMPVLQAFGQDSRGKPQIEKRLPTSKEMRYITYASIQHNATGVFFWSRYRSRKDWISKVLTPLSKEVAPALPAMARGPIPGASATGKMEATLFRHPKTKAYYLVAVHHGAGTIKAPIKISSALKAVRATSKDGLKKISGGTLTDTFGPYAARLYRLS